MPRSYYVVSTLDDRNKSHDFSSSDHWCILTKTDNPVYHELSKKQQGMERGDRIALYRPKTKFSSNNMIILALGIVVYYDSITQTVKVDWIRKNMNREVRSRTCDQVINGPFYEGKEGQEIDNWLGKVFRL
jgi:hypothetical protein